MGSVNDPGWRPRLGPTSALRLGRRRVERGQRYVRRTSASHTLATSTRERSGSTAVAIGSRRTQPGRGRRFTPSNPPGVVFARGPWVFSPHGANDANATTLDAPVAPESLGAAVKRASALRDQDRRPPQARESLRVLSTQGTFDWWGPPLWDGHGKRDDFAATRRPTTAFWPAANRRPEVENNGTASEPAALYQLSPNNFCNQQPITSTLTNDQTSLPRNTRLT